MARSTGSSYKPPNCAFTAGGRWEGGCFLSFGAAPRATGVIHGDLHGRARRTLGSGLGSLTAGQVGGVLMSAVDGGVHAHHPVDQPGRISPGNQCLVHPIPGPVTRETAVPLPPRLSRPELLGKITPGDPAPVPIDHALRDLPVVPHRPPSPRSLRRQQRLDHRPLLIGQQLLPRHPASLLLPGTRPLETRPRSRRGSASCKAALEGAIRTGSAAIAWSGCWARESSLSRC